MAKIIKLTENDIKYIIKESINTILLYQIYKRNHSPINENSYAENIDSEYYYAADFNEVANLRGALMQVALGLTKNRDKAEDLVQNTIIRAFEKNELFKDGTNLFAWLKTIMTNIFKREKNNPRKNIKYIDDYSSYDKYHYEDDANQNMQKEAPKNNMVSIINRMNQSIDNLANKKGDIYKKVYQLKMNGEKIKDIADNLGLNFDTTKYYLKMIRNQLKKDGFHDEIKNLIEI